MYEKLNGIVGSMNEGNIEEAVNSYLSVDRSLITAEPLLSQLQDVDRLMLNEAFDSIVQRGTDNWNAGDKEKA